MNFDYLFNIKGKKVILTGGTRGIGKSIVEELVRSGALVTVLGFNEENLNMLKEKFPNVDIYKCNLKVENEITKFCNEFIKKNSSCDILINNAGISSDNLVENIDSEEFYDVFRVNLFAPFLLTKHLLPSMKSQRSGVILNIASTLGTRAASLVSAYASSKAALIHFTRCLSIEVAPFNIRVNCISPGYCKTDLNKNFFETEQGQNFVKNKIPMQRMLEKEELLPMIRLLISEAGSYITGANIIIDGGVGNW